MTAALLLSLVLVDPSDAGKDRQPHPLAPSIPQLTQAEEAKIQKIIDRFIAYDIGKLKGAEGRQALEDFNRLGPEAIFQLIDSFNVTAELQDSCPVVIIGKKIASILNRSSDLELLIFAKETLGAGVVAKRHLGSVKDIQFGVQLRRGAVQRQIAVGAAPAFGKAPSLMTGAELAQAARQDKGLRLQGILNEASKRPAPMALDILAIAATRPDKEVMDLGQVMIAKSLAKQTDADVRKLLKHDKAEMRAAGAIACAGRGWGSELLELLQDSELPVRKAALKSLVQLNGGKNLGPTSWASPGEVNAAVVRWQSWWVDRQKK